MSQWVIAEVSHDHTAEMDILSLLSCSGEVVQSKLLSEEGVVPSRWGVQFTENTKVEYCVALSGSQVRGSPLTVRLCTKAEREQLEGPSPGLLATVASVVYTGATKAVVLVIPTSSPAPVVAAQPQFEQVGDGNQPQWGRIASQ